MWEKSTCPSGRKKSYHLEKMVKGWTPDVIKGRAERPISCSARTLYRHFEKGLFNQTMFPMRGKRKPNGYKKKRGKQAFRRSLIHHQNDYPMFETEFGHQEGDTIIGKQHKSAVITLVERLSKVIITLKPSRRKASDIEETMIHWLVKMPKNHISGPSPKKEIIFQENH